ncbi:MAG TPA: hypothetical protein VH969_03630 [Actinophytocola sp.]|uniref:hypothetical protein n=1 Tax=Actinophytocola sp. TaxID=1872138 RepID=UPI002F959B6F
MMMPNASSSSCVPPKTSRRAASAALTRPPPMAASSRLNSLTWCSGGTVGVTARAIVRSPTVSTAASDRNVTSARSP